MAFLNLWNYVKEQQKALSGNQFRKQMGREFIHFMRLREWQDIYTQSRQTVREMGLSINEEPATFEQVHRALITGLLSQVGFKEDRHEYQGTRQTRFHIFPGSGLFGKPPKWVVTAELAETSKLYARINADIDPLWIEEAAPHLVKNNTLSLILRRSKAVLLPMSRSRYWDLFWYPEDVSSLVRFHRLKPGRYSFAKGWLIHS